MRSQERELVEQIVLGTEHDGRRKIVQASRRIADHLLAVALRAQSTCSGRSDRRRSRSCESADARPCLRRPRRSCVGNSTCAFANSGPYGLPRCPCRMPTRLITASASATNAASCDRIVHVGFDHVDGQQGEMRGVGAPPRGDAHVLAEIDERVDEMTADEAGTADQRTGSDVAFSPLWCATARGNRAGVARTRAPSETSARGVHGALRRDVAQTRLQRLRTAFEQRRVVDRVRQHVLDVVARLGERNRFSKNRAFDRTLQIAAATCADGPGPAL